MGSSRGCTKPVVGLDDCIRTLCYNMSLVSAVCIPRSGGSPDLLEIFELNKRHQELAQTFSHITAPARSTASHYRPVKTFVHSYQSKKKLKYEYSVDP